MKLKSAFQGLLILSQLLVIPFQVNAAGGDAERGAALYDSRCGACHSIERNRVGPRHQELFGRSAGTQPGYAYSKALADSDIVWNEQTLDNWLTNPQALIPGQKMGFRVRKAGDRSDIIAFLRSLKGLEGGSVE